MKHFYFFLLCLLFPAIVFADPVDEKTALTVGKAFVTNNSNSPVLKSAVSLKTALRITGKDLSLNQAPAATYYYVFNVDSRGFVIVAGDDAVMPILGYSDEGNFDPARIPENVAKWLEGYKREIRYILDHHIPATKEISDRWAVLKQGQGFPEMSSTQSAGPLLATKWNQAPYYNDLCPIDYQAGERAVTGCVATAMAQIMKYWNYPEKGSGFHSYNTERFGTLSANFGNTTYDWASMPNSINSANAAIATLMYHVGISVDMSYGTGEQGGSSAYVLSAQSPVINCSEYALKNYFGYKSSLQGVEKDNYTSSQWIALLKTEFDASRPVLYAGFGSGGGHCFVADGYDNNNYIHFNWGWGGAYDGFFQVNALNPDGLGIGGGTGSYNTGQQAIIGIQPVQSSTHFELALYNYVSISDNPIGYTQPFSITTNIANNGTGAYSGDYAAAIFDESANFVDFVEVKTGQSLESGYAYTNNLVFSSDGMVSLLPGNYYAGIFYKPTGGNWMQLADDGDYSNMIPFAVTYSNDIELHSDMTVSPGTTLIQGEEASVNLNIINTGSQTFKGQYAVGLFDLNGDAVQTIDVVDETDGLPSGYTYLDPYLTFTTSSVDVDPGSYLMAVMHKPSGGDWILTGSTDYQNPIRVIVQAAGVPPDIYEDNNATQDAYDLPVSFSQNTAHVTTDGSNCHVGTDYDYYKIDLPAGYAYTIAPRLQDSYNSNDGNVYTLDALFSASLDGDQWSDAFDDVPDGVIELNNGGTVYFMVSPYFTGETGNYLLDMHITRGSSSGIKDPSSDASLKVYPNPARDLVNISTESFHGTIRKIEVVDAAGNPVLYPATETSGSIVNVSLNSLPDGVYGLRIYTDDGISTKKIIIQH
jgi:hypothetical protein